MGRQLRRAGKAAQTSVRENHTWSVSFVGLEFDSFHATNEQQFLLRTFVLFDVVLLGVHSEEQHRTLYGFIHDQYHFVQPKKIFERCVGALNVCVFSF